MGWEASSADATGLGAVPDNDERIRRESCLFKRAARAYIRVQESRPVQLLHSSDDERKYGSSVSIWYPLKKTALKYQYLKELQLPSNFHFIQTLVVSPLVTSVAQLNPYL
jgi:hypothetical protein